MAENLYANALKTALTVFGLCLVWAGTIAAQTVTGTIKGVVEDTSGALVPAVAIEIVNTETGLMRTAETGSDGSYQVTFIPLGRYKVTAVKDGFGTIIRENIDVTLNQTTAVDFKIDPAVTATVTVTDEPPQINTTNAEIKGTLSETEIEAKPTFNQGNFLTLAETFTGYQENPASGQNNPTASSGSSINFNGTGTRGATFQINGVNNDDTSENQNRQGASLATIKEFQVLTNNFSAEFGRGYGAVVLVQTKQGTNRFSGEAFIYHNNSALNAKRHFSTHLAKPVNRRNQYGAVIGFPILKNRLFGFLSFDQKLEGGDQNIRRDIFTAFERNPANWFNISSGNNTPANRAFIQSVIDRFPAVAPNDPSAPVYPTGVRRTYAALQKYNRPAEDYSARLDWNARESDTVTFRYQRSLQIFESSDIIVGETTRQNNSQQNYGLTWTHIFGPNLSGEFRYGLGIRDTNVGINAGNTTPVIRFVGTPFASTIGNAGTFPIERYQRDNQLVYNASAIVFNDHFLKIGTDLRFARLDDLADSFSRGFYNIGNICNGVTYASSYEAFYNGCISTYQRGYGPFFLENRINEYNFYAEDNYKARQNLTLNLGFRYEYVAAPREIEDRIAYGYGDDKDNYEPRVGLAYSPAFEKGMLGKFFGGAGKSSIRMGYGIYHGRIFQSVFSQSGVTLRFNPPNSLQRTFTGSTNLTDPSNGFVFVPGTLPARASLALADKDLQMPYTQQWTASFERQLAWKTALRLTYSGNRGIGLLRFRLVNLPSIEPDFAVVNDPRNAPGVLYPIFPNPVGAIDPRNVDVRGQILRPAANFQCAGTGYSGVIATAACPLPAPGAVIPLGPLEYSARIPRVNERRADPRYATNTEISNGAWSYYHALQVEFNKRLSDKLSFTTNYTFSKAIDTVSDATAIGAGDSNATGPRTRLARGFSLFHTPHRFTLFVSYQNPFFDKRKDWIGQLLGGWYTSVVYKAAVGNPFTVSVTAADIDLDGSAEARPVLLDPSVLGTTVSNPGSSTTRLPLSAFRAATIDDIRDGSRVLGRNTFFRDGLNNVDLGFYKSFQLPFEGQRLVVRADLFNAFNRVRYGLPGTAWSAGSTTFGRIATESGDYLPRNIQLSLRYVF